MHVCEYDRILEFLAPETMRMIHVYSPSTLTPIHHPSSAYPSIRPSLLLTPQRVFWNLRRWLRASLGHGSSVCIRKALVLALLAVLPGWWSVKSFRGYSRARDTGKLTLHLANLSSISPRRSAAILLSSFRLRRTACAATDRYLL
jgi:hypothetical protein